jgi:hypothetical protein
LSALAQALAQTDGEIDRPTLVRLLAAVSQLLAELVSDAGQ